MWGDHVAVPPSTCLVIQYEENHNYSGLNGRGMDRQVPAGGSSPGRRGAQRHCLQDTPAFVSFVIWKCIFIWMAVRFFVPTLHGIRLCTIEMLRAACLLTQHSMSTNNNPDEWWQYKIYGLQSDTWLCRISYGATTTVVPDEGTYLPPRPPPGVRWRLGCPRGPCPAGSRGRPPCRPYTAWPGSGSASSGPASSCTHLCSTTSHTDTKSNQRFLCMTVIFLFSLIVSSFVFS